MKSLKPCHRGGNRYSEAHGQLAAVPAEIESIRWRITRRDNKRMQDFHPAYALHTKYTIDHQFYRYLTYIYLSTYLINEHDSLHTPTKTQKLLFFIVFTET
jgi:hypothetical protein